MKTASPAKAAAAAAPPKAATVAPSKEQPSNRLWAQIATQSSGIRIGDVSSESERRADQVAQAATGERRESASTAGALHPQFVASHTAAHISAPDSGELVAANVRQPVEREVGRDLSHARIHNSATDHQHADAMGARAFAYGNHIWLGSRGSLHDRRLLSHELAHVAHAPRGMVHRDPDPAPSVAPIPAPAPPVSPPSPAPPTPPSAAPSAPAPSAPIASSAIAPAANDSSVVELKGAGTFRPSAALAKELQQSAEEWQQMAALAASTAGGITTGSVPLILPPGGGEKYVHVRFGEMADGVIPVRWTPRGYETPAPKENYPAWGITLRHAAFPRVRGAEPTLWVEIRKSAVTGGMGWKTPLAFAEDAEKFRAAFPREQLFGGMAGFQNVQLSFIGNKLANGAFVYTAFVQFDDDVYHGFGQIRVLDEAYKFEGGIYVPVSGLPHDAKLPVTRESGESLSSLMSGSVTWKFDRKMDGGRLAASVTATLTNGAIDIRGFGSYNWRDPKDADRHVDGKVTIIITSFEKAQQAVRDHLEADAPANIAPAGDDSELAITGWGQLDLTLSDWISGNAEVIVHPEGYVTARGEILPKKVVKISDRRQKEWTLFDPPRFSDVIYAVPLVGDVRLEADTKITANASFGPGTLHDLRIQGLISSHPDIVNRFEVGGTISAPGEAALHLTASVGLAAYILHAKELSSVRLTADGVARLKLYVEADAAVGRRPSKKDPAVSEYYLKAHALAAAGLEFGLKLSARGSMMLVGKLDIELMDRIWQIGGTGAKLDVTYVFGRGHENDSEVSASFSDAEFDDHKFARAISRGKALERKGFKGDTQANTTSASDVKNPAAPEPFAPSDPNAPANPSAANSATPVNPDAPAPSSTALVKILDEPFSMNGEQHDLYLTLTDPATIEMASPTPRESLFKKIKRAREKLEQEKASGKPATAALNAQLASLRNIELQATQVVVAAVRISESSPYLEPSVPGYHQLAVLIQDYGDKYAVTDLNTALTKATADPADPGNVLQPYPNLAADALDRGQVARILDEGVSASTLKAIFRYCTFYKYPDSQARELLSNIFNASTRGIPGFRVVLNEMASQHTKTRGGEFVLRYIGQREQWSAHILLEAGEDDANSDRRWDAWINGTLFEFKAWSKWSDKLDQSFVRQMTQDYGKVKAGADMPLRWVFNGDIPLSTIHAKADAAIRKERAKVLEGKSNIPNASLEMMDAILGQITKIMFVFKGK